MKTFWDGARGITPGQHPHGNRLALAASAPGPLRSHLEKGGEASHSGRQGGCLGQGEPSEEAGFGKHCLGAALGARVGRGAHARRSPWGSKGWGTCFLRKGCGAQALGELLGGCDGVGAGAGSCSRGRRGSNMGREMLGCRMSVPEPWGNTQQRGPRDPPPQQSCSHHASMGAGVPCP